MQRMIRLLALMGFSINAWAGVSLPLEREVYVIGETVPVAFTDAGKVDLVLKPELGNSVHVYKGVSQPILLDTQFLAQGTYQWILNGQPTGSNFTLVSPLRSSAGAFINEQVFPVREQDTLPQMEQSGLNVVFGMGFYNNMQKADPRLDQFLAYKGSFFLNPSTRPTSFKPPRVWDWEMDNWKMRLAQISQAQLRYPSFSGICFEWDAGDIVRHPSIFFRMGKYDEQWRQYQADSNVALEKEFQEKIGLKAPSTREIIRYAVTIDRPEYGPVMDLPSFRWMQRIAKHIEPLSEKETAELHNRITAWHTYLMKIYGKGHIEMQKSLDRIDPGMAHTSSVNLDHGRVNQGHFTP